MKITSIIREMPVDVDLTDWNNKRVSFYGREIGKVISSEFDEENNVIVTMQIDDDYVKKLVKDGTRCSISVGNNFIQMKEIAS